MTGNRFGDYSHVVLASTREICICLPGSQAAGGLVIEDPVQTGLYQSDFIGSIDS